MLSSAARTRRPAARRVPSLPDEDGRPTRADSATIVATGAVATGFAVGMIILGWRGYHDPWLAFLLAQMVGVSFLAAGLIAWWRRPANRIGPLMVAAGASWYVTHLQDSGIPVLFALGYWLTYLSPVIYAHLAIVYPEGRATTRFQRWIIAAAYISYLTLQGARYVAEGSTPVGWDPSPITVWANVLSVNGLVFNVMACVIVVRRWLTASRPARRVHELVWLGIVYTDLVLAIGTTGSILGIGALTRKLLVLGYGLGLVAMPFLFLSGLLRVRLAQLRVADLVVELERTSDPSRLRDLLAQALADPALVLGFWSDDLARYVDAEGRPVTVPEPEVDRAVTFVGPGERHVAVLIHDPALAQQRSLMHAVMAAARLALENARLQAVLRAQLAELRASRARIAQAAVNERRKIERDLHDGVQQRLLRLSWLVKRAVAMTALAEGGAAIGSVLDELAEEARTAHTELRDLAQGIYPSIVTERGLAAAVEEYAMRAPLPVYVDIPPDRWPPAVEVTAFFVIMEAAVNTAKHAGADEVRVRVWQSPGQLGVEVCDDGAGGADLRRGTGLHGLQDRVNALGGTFTVDSVRGQGTRVRAELPCD